MVKELTEMEYRNIFGGRPIIIFLTSSLKKYVFYN